MFDRTGMEDAQLAIITGIVAAIFGSIAVLTNISFFAGVAVVAGAWALIYGIMALVKGKKND